MKNFKNLLAALMLAGALVSGAQAALRPATEGDSEITFFETSSPKDELIQSLWETFCERDYYGAIVTDARDSAKFHAVLTRVGEEDLRTIKTLMNTQGCMNPGGSYTIILALAYYAQQYPGSLAAGAFTHFMDNALGTTREALPVVVSRRWGHQNTTPAEDLEYTRVKTAALIISELVASPHFRDFISSGHLAACATSLRLQYSPTPLRADLFIRKVLRWTATRGLVHTRALVLAGRAREASAVAPTPAAGLMVILCSRAPLWVVQRVAKLLQEA